MNKRKEFENMLAQHIFELRFEPMPTFLDDRGQIVEVLKKEIGFKHWSISRNKIDLSFDEKGEKEKGFVSFRNCGYVSVFPPTRNYFPDKACKFIRELFLIKQFNPQNLIRLGVKLTVAIAFDGTFEELTEILKEKLIKTEGKIFKAYDAKVIDIGVPLNFETKDGFFNTRLGPMKEEEVKQTFTEVKEWEKKIPRVNLFFQIDYYNKGVKKGEVENVCGCINNYTKKAWEIFDKVEKSIIG